MCSYPCVDDDSQPPALCSPTHSRAGGRRGLGVTQATELLYDVLPIGLESGDADDDPRDDWPEI